MKNLFEMSKNDDYTTGNLSDFSYHQDYYKLISIDLSIQPSTTIPQQINFTGKLEENDGVTMCFLLQQKLFWTFLRFIKCNRII